MFDTSKDKGKADKVQKGFESDEDDIDTGFGSNKKTKENIEKKSDNDLALEAEMAALGRNDMGSDGEELTDEQQIKHIEDQF